MIKKIESFYLYMLGKPEEFLLEEKIILGIIYLSTFAYCIGLCTSIIQKNPIISGVFILYILLMFSFIYLARFKKKFYFFPGIALTIIPLCILWFFNGGISGGTPYLFIFPIIISPLIGKKIDKMLLILLSALAMIGLLSIEYFIPNTIFPHKSRELRFIDLFTSYIISCGVIFFIVQKVVKEYQAQKDFLEMKTDELRTWIPHVNFVFFKYQ